MLCSVLAIAQQSVNCISQSANRIQVTCLVNTVGAVVTGCCKNAAKCCIYCFSVSPKGGYQQAPFLYIGLHTQGHSYQIARCGATLVGWLFLPSGKKSAPSLKNAVWLCSCVKYMTLCNTCASGLDLFGLFRLAINQIDCKGLFSFTLQIQQRAQSHDTHKNDITRVQSSNKRIIVLNILP